MQQERWRRIDELFHSALELDTNRRAVFLEESCSGDLDLRMQVERLLIHYDDSFLEEPALELAAEERREHAPLPAIEGEIVAHYLVGAKVGSGGMGVVYEGEDLKLGRGVALKFLYDDLTRERQAIGRLEVEARAASSLNHPNICTIYAIEEHRGRPVLVMELLEGENLLQRIKAGSISTEEMIRLGTQACDALGAAHEKGIVHCDIKPANVFVTREGRLKLLDFGVARWMRRRDATERRDRIAGTMLYMSPEQLRGDEIDGRTDLYSLGVVLYELLTGVRPFERSSVLRMAEAVLNDEAAAPSSLNPALPAKLDRVIGKMIQKDRDRRYGCAADVSRDLQLIGESHTRTGRKWKIAGVGACLALISAVTAMFFESHRRPVLTNKDTIVLAEFTNKTGDPIFSDTLRQGLAVQLQQSPFLSLISEDRTRQMLRLMAKSPNTPLTTEIAREVCQRTESAAVLDGSITSFGKRYLLLLRAQDCRTGDLLFSEQAEASAKEDVLHAISQMARNFRAGVGESLATIEKHSTPLSQATTPSLEAWRAFSEGWSVGMQGGHAAAIPFLKRAIEIDPKFASAYAFLGRDYSAIGEMEQAREFTRRAYETRERATDQERFFIDYSYDRLVTGNLEKAMDTCELWTHMYPRDVRAHSLYGATAKVLGRFEKAMEEEKKALEVDPDHPHVYVHLISLALYQRNFSEARRWLQRASERKLNVPEFLMLRYLMAFLEGNQREMETVAAEAEHRSEIQDWVWGERAQVLAFSGRLQNARMMSRHAVEVALAADRRESAAQHEAAAAVREALFGNAAEARMIAARAQRRSRGQDAEYGAALTYAFAGDSAQALLSAKELERRYPEDTQVRFSIVPTIRAIVAVQGGEPTKAVDLLSIASRYELGYLGCCSVGFVGSLYPVYARGEAYLALHRGLDAAGEFEKVLHHRGLGGSNPIGVLAHWRRGKALAMAQKDLEAKAEYEQFLSFWREADAQVPILRRVKAEYRELLGRSN